MTRVCPAGSEVKASAYNAGDLGLIPGSGRSPGEGSGSPLQYSCLENPHGQRSPAGCSPWGHRGGHNWATVNQWSYSVVPDSLGSHGLHLTRLPHPCNFPGKSTGVGCISLSRGSSRPRDQTQVSCIVGRRFNLWATREAWMIFMNVNYLNKDAIKFPIEK